MERKYTKGPWSAVYSKRYKQWNVFGASNKAVASADDLDGELSVEETEANANLIAAAPELLEALVMIQDHIRFGQDLDGIDIVCSEAIAKALGETE